jgi:hypothetical protein
MNAFTSNKIIAAAIFNVLIAPVAHAVTSNGYTGYAETIYGNFQKYAADEISFKITTLSSTSLAGMGNYTPESLLSSPAYDIRATIGAITLKDVQFTGYETEWRLGEGRDIQFKQLESVDLPLDQGVIRYLSVEATIKLDKRVHNAFEMCWPKLGHCVVMDNAIPWLDSIVHDLEKTEESGWASQPNNSFSLPISTSSTILDAQTKPLDAQTKPVAKAYCLLNYHLRTYYPINMASYNRTKKDYLQRTMYNITVGQISGYLSCDASCKAQGSLFVDGSSARSNRETRYTFKCDTQSASQSQTYYPTAQLVGVTGCGKNGPDLPVATFSYSIFRIGNDLKWSRNTNASYFENAGTWTDFCKVVG